MATYLKAKTVHLQEHLTGEEHNKEQIGVFLEVVQPCRLSIVFSRQNASVQKYQNDNQPKHPLGFTSLSRRPSDPPVGLVEGLFLLLKPSVWFRLDSILFFGLLVGMELRCNRH